MTLDEIIIDALVFFLMERLSGIFGGFDKEGPILKVFVQKCPESREQPYGVAYIAQQ